MTAALLSPMAAAVAELAADPGVAAITTRIRPYEPGPGDSKGAGAYLPFVVVSVLDSTPEPRMPVRHVLLGIRAYAATDPAAEALWMACEAVFQDRGQRVATSGLGVWFSIIQAGGIPDRDPDTKQPLVHGIVRYPTTIGSVTP